MSAYYFFVFAGIGIVVPFFPLYLRQIGLSYTQIGTLSALSSGVGAVTQLLLGAFSDRLGRRKPLIVAVASLQGIAYLLFQWIAPSQGGGQRVFLPLALLYSWIGFCSFTGFTLAASMVLDLSLPGQEGHTFARSRIWGSIGFVTMMIVGGAFPALFHPPRLFWLSWGLYFLAGLSALRCTEPPRKHLSAPPALQEAAALLWRKDLIILLLAVFFFSGSLQTATGNLSLLIRHLQGNERLITFSMLVSALVEIPFMLGVGRLSDQFGRKPVLVIGSAVLPLRLWLYSLVGHPGWIPLIQMLHGLTFSIITVVPLAFINDIVPERLRASGQSLLFVAYGTSSSLLPLFGGMSADLFGLQEMYQILALLSFLSFLLILFLLPESKSEEGIGAKAKNKGF